MKKILLISAWQDVNIGDIAHTPGLLHVMEKFIPDAEIALWPWHPLTAEVRKLITTRFPKLKIVSGDLNEDGTPTTQEIADAFDWCDLLLHGSGPMLCARERVKGFIETTGKPYGVFGITYDGNPWFREVLDKAEFIYFRDTVSLYRAMKDGCACRDMQFGPDAAFAYDIVNDEYAEKFLAENDLEEGRFVCCIGRYRWTPFWEIKPEVPYNEEKDKFNTAHKEKDHEQLVEAVVKIVRELGMKVLLCPECRSEIQLEKDMIYDRLPEDVKPMVVWKSDFWAPDEAMGVYMKCAGLFGNEMHSPIMCIGNGIPALICRCREVTSKGYMWNDIGLGQWMFNQDVEDEMMSVPYAVVNMLTDTEKTKAMVESARTFVEGKFKEMCAKVEKYI